MKVVRSLGVASDPQEVLVQPDGKVAYVSCASAGEVVVVDLTSWRLIDGIQAGTEPDGLAWAEAR